MSLFDFTFSLTAVILGLALTHMAATLHKLLLAGRRTKWAPEPILLALLVMMVTVVLWLTSWRDRGETSVAYWLIFLRVFALLILFFTAASCLPEAKVEADSIDTYAYYDRTRLLSFGSLIVSYLIWSGLNLVSYGWAFNTPLSFLLWLLFPTVYATLIFVRRRWLNIAGLSAAILVLGLSAVGFTIAN